MRVVVVGSGLTAPHVAAAFALAGDDVVVAGRDAARAAAAAERALAHAPGGSIASAQLGEAAVADAGLVLETVAEDAEVKRDVLARLSAWAPAAVLATNTSSLPLATLAEAVADPSRFLGLHFLTPAHETGVIEIIRGEATGDAAVEVVLDVARRMDKTPIVARRDVPGFIWNRLQAALLREALHLVDEGVADAATVDAAVTDGLAPRWLATGPLAAADLGGVHIWRRVADGLFGELGTATSAPPTLAETDDAGGTLLPWTDERRASAVALRTETLALGRELRARPGRRPDA